MDKIQTGLDVLFIFAESVFYYQMAEIFLKRRWEDFRRYGYLLSIVLAFLIMGKVNEYFTENAMISGVFQRSSWIVLFLLLHIFYQGKLLKKAINIALDIFVVAFGEVVLLLSVFVFQIQLGDVWDEPILYNSLQGISKIIILLLALGIKQYNAKSRDGIALNYTKEMLIIGVVDLATVFVGTLLVQYNETVQFSLNEEIAIVLCGVFVISFVSIVIMGRLSERARKETQLKLQLQHFQLEQKYREDIKQLTGQLRALRHDMNNHIGVMKGLLDLKQYEELEKYFSGIVNTLQMANDIVLTDSQALSVLLNTKTHQADNLGVELELIVSKEKIGMDDQDLCALVGNLLDNAIEAAGKSEEKYVFFSLQQREKEIIIKCENSYVMLPKVKKDGTFFTTKKDKQQHGIGTKVIKEIVEKYHGTQEIQCADTFELVIMLQF